MQMVSLKMKTCEVKISAAKSLGACSEYAYRWFPQQQKLLGSSARSLLGSAMRSSVIKAGEAVYSVRKGHCGPQQ